MDDVNDALYRNMRKDKRIKTSVLFMSEVCGNFVTEKMRSPDPPKFFP
jgi:hypothetical protein